MTEQEQAHRLASEESVFESNILTVLEIHHITKHGRYAGAAVSVIVTIS